MRLPAASEETPEETPGKARLDDRLNSWTEVVDGGSMTAFNFDEPELERWKETG